jgi:poly(3-hydroxybutyrate) depolymerase
LAGCAVTQSQDTPVQHGYWTDPATRRGYWWYVPSSYRPDRPSPLVVTCHGTPPFDVAEHHIREWKMLGEQYGCIVVAPSLIATDGILGDGPIAGMLADEKYILSLIAFLSAHYNVDRANVMITGFSGGGFPTYWVGLRHPDVITAVAIRNCNFSEWNLDGWYPPEALQTSLLVYYGENDPAAIQLQSRAAIQYLGAKGFRVESVVLASAGHERHPEVAMQFFRRHWHTPKPSMTLGTPAMTAGR